MLPPKQIAIATDFSVGSRQVLPYAMDLARQMDSALHVVYAQVHRCDLTSEAEWRGRLAGLIRRIPPGLRVTYAVETGAEAALCLLKYAERNAIDLLVLGTHCAQRYTHVPPVSLGTVTRDVLQQASCPILTVDATPCRARSTADIRAVLVPVDFSNAAGEVLRQARELAAAYNVRLDLLHVVPDSGYPVFYHFEVLGETTPAEPCTADLEVRAADALRRLNLTGSGAAGPATVSVRRGLPAREILVAAEQFKSDLVFMSMPRCTGAPFVLTGNVTETVARLAPCPVLTVKTPCEPSRCLLRDIAALRNPAPFPAFP